LASVRQDVAQPGTELEIEVTVEYERRLCRAKVVKTPFFNPARKRAITRQDDATPESEKSRL